MGGLVVAVLALMVVGLALVAAVMYREGHFDQVTLPRWIGWRIDLDDAYDVWPVEHDLTMIAALHAEAIYLDIYRENR